MERHIKVARAHRALSWLYGLIAVLVMVSLFASHERLDMVGVFVVLLIFGGLFSLPHFTGRGARAKKPWARTVSRLVAVLMLFGFPLGTLIGIYLLANAWNPWDDGVVEASA